ncbi:uncharacterized protein METZ01_LOCUS441441, partial [marine metagenome]
VDVVRFSSDWCYSIYNGFIRTTINGDISMIDFQEFLAEGVYDRNIFKAFFLAGGPGSGKSWVSAKTLSGAGLKVINSDAAFERLLAKERMSLDFKGY